MVQVLHRRTADSTALAFANYTYDVTGNRLTLTDMPGTHSYTYDNDHRLTGALHPGLSTLPTQSESFNYDAAHNRTADAVLTNYAYDAADRLLSNSGFTYAYDANGNRTRVTRTATGSQTQYSWNSSGELIHVARPDGVTVDYVYDAFSHLVQKTVSTTTVTTTIYVRDGPDIIATLDTNNALTALITHSDFDNQPLAINQSGTDYYYHADALGSIIALSDINAQVVERAEYTSYGHPVYSDINGSTYSASQKGAIYGYIGAEWADEIGLSRNGIRYLDLHLGQFISEEPLGLDGTNRYWYAGANPNKYLDRDGAQEAPVATAVAEVAAGAVAAAEVVGGIFSAEVTLPTAALIAAIGIAKQIIEDKQPAPAPNPNGGQRKGPPGKRGRNCPPKASNARLQKTIDIMFKPSDTIPGGTAGAIRNELLTDIPTGGRFHKIKGEQTINRLRNIISQENLSRSDLDIANQLIQDLTDALNGR
jgi:RHS repeat-associated protein